MIAARSSIANQVTRMGASRAVMIQAPATSMLVLRTSSSSSSSSSSTSVGYLERQRKLGRPVSPHVTIYAFPLAAISSVTHRITGVALAVGMYGIGLGNLVGCDVAESLYQLGSIPMLGSLVKFSISFPLIYHYVAGIRHFYWEARPEGLNPESQYQASLAVIGVSVAGTLPLLFL